MVKKFAKGADVISDHYVLFLLVLTLMGLTIIGVGDTTTVSMLGMVLCGAGIFQKPGRVDLQILLPVLVYLLIGAASSYAAIGNITHTYTATHAIYPVLYLLMASLEEKELLWLRRFSALWVSYVAANGVVQFLLKALDGTAGRLGGMMSNPNSMGIFLVVGWFGLTAWAPGPEESGPLPALLRRLEPLLLTALALTLSMGSFLALAVGMAVRAAGWVKASGWRGAAEQSSRMLAKAALCVGAGILMYFTGRNTSAPWLCLGLALWLLALMCLWEKFDRFLLAYRWFPWAMCAGGFAVALAAVAVRPSAAATFVERLEMMCNGLTYLTVNPLLGVGPYQWRLLNMTDGDTYFNTWHIHNVPIHIGVELGLIAMTAAVLVILRTLSKRGRNVAGFAAFLLHNLMDTSFFYMGTTTAVLFTVGEPECDGRQLGAIVFRAAFVIFGLLFIYYYIFGPRLQ